MKCDETCTSIMLSIYMTMRHMYPYFNLFLCLGHCGVCVCLHVGSVYDGSFYRNWMFWQGIYINFKFAKNPLSFHNCEQF